MYESPPSPRKVVLKPGGHEGRTDTSSIEERASNAIIGARIFNSAAPSSSRKIERSCRSNLIIFFETLEECQSYSPGSTSIDLSMWNGIVTLGEDGLGNDVCFGLALAASLTALVPISSLRFSCISSDISVTCLFSPLSIITQEWDKSPNKELILISIR